MATMKVTHNRNKEGEPFFSVRETVVLGGSVSMERRTDFKGSLKAAKQKARAYCKRQRRELETECLELFSTTPRSYSIGQYEVREHEGGEEMALIEQITISEIGERVN